METTEENNVPRGDSMSETQHEPHEHASRRVVIGVTATVLIFVLGGFIWSRWGDAIEDICFGEEGACRVEPAPSPADESTDFTTPPEYQF